MSEWDYVDVKQPYQGEDFYGIIFVIIDKL